MGDDPKSNSVLLIAASIIAAVRLAREEIKPSPKVQFEISQSVTLAQMISKRINGL